MKDQIIVDMADEQHKYDTTHKIYNTTNKYIYTFILP